MALDVGRVNITMKKNMRAAAMEIGAYIKNRAQWLTPVDTGFLRASAVHRLQAETPQRVAVDIIFEANYARIQHENTWFKHTTGQAKFLSDAIEDAKTKIPRIIAKYI